MAVDYKKEISRLRSEVRKTQKKIENFKEEVKTTSKEISPFSGLVSGNYWTQTGMPWASGEGRKAVLTEYFWQNFQLVLKVPVTYTRSAEAC
jgi:hypothetical protein